MLTYWLFLWVDWEQDHNYLSGTWHHFIGTFFIYIHIYMLKCIWKNQDLDITRGRLQPQDSRLTQGWKMHEQVLTNELMNSVDVFEFRIGVLGVVCPPTSCCLDFYIFWRKKTMDHIAPSNTKWCWWVNLAFFVFSFRFFGFFFFLFMVFLLLGLFFNLPGDMVSLSCYLVYHNLVEGGRCDPTKQKAFLHCIAQLTGT